VREIREHCRRLTKFPEAAPLRPEFGDGVRLSILNRYLIFYIVHGDPVQIRRVVHGARNLSDIT
jgi:toxin ParE1/3/4